MYRLMARAVSWIHWIWTFALLVGFILQWVFPQYALIVVVALGITLVSQVWWKRCPLTIIEDRLRVKYGTGGAIGNSFLRHNLEKRFDLHIPRGAITATLKAMFVVSVSLWLFTFFP